MTRVRLSTTVDSDLLAEARRLRSQSNDSMLLEEALRSLVARNRSVEIDAAYGSYDLYPIDSHDEWGSLGEFRNAAAAS